MEDRQTPGSSLAVKGKPQRGRQIAMLEAATSFLQRMVDSGVAADFGEDVAQRMFGDLPQPYRAHGAFKRRYRRFRRRLHGW